MIRSGQTQSTVADVVQPADLEPRRVGEVLLLEDFSAATVGPALRRCYQALRATALGEERSLMFAFAIQVGLLNAVQHGGGSGVLSLICDGDDRLVAAIVDRGGSDRPPTLAQAPGERGLSLAERLVDELTLRSGQHGTTLRLAVIVAGPGRYRWAGSPHDARLAALIETILFDADNP